LCQAAEAVQDEFMVSLLEVEITAMRGVV